MQQTLFMPQAPLGRPPNELHTLESVHMPPIPFPSVQEVKGRFGWTWFGSRMKLLGSREKSWAKGLTALFMFDRPNAFWRV